MIIVFQSACDRSLQRDEWPGNDKKELDGKCASTVNRLRGQRSLRHIEKSTFYDLKIREALPSVAAVLRPLYGHQAAKFGRYPDRLATEVHRRQISV